MNVRFLVPAEEEMLDAAIYYELQSLNLGGNFLNIVEEAVAEIAGNPEVWPEMESSIRRRLLRRFPYSLLYTIHEDDVIIVAVMHQKQKPHYWRGRL